MFHTEKPPALCQDRPHQKYSSPSSHVFSRGCGYDYLIPPGIQVTKTENMLQIPVMALNKEARLLGVRFRDHNDEEQFVFAVSEKISK